jgi:hypothetical protein
VQEYASPARPGDSPGPASYDPERDGFDMTWARSADAHELSAHGRTVQQRLDAPTPRQGRPSLIKRARFAVYRLFHTR